MKFSFSHLKGDMFGGITAGIVALPLALAFGVQSGLGAIAGLYGAIALGIIAAFFGGTETQISGPTGPMTVVSSIVVATAINKMGGLDAGYAMIITTFFVAGILQIILGFTGVGRYIKYVPYPVISGFMSGIGVIIIVFQIFPMLGQPSPTTIIDTLTSVGSGLRGANLAAIIATMLTFGIIQLLPRFTKTIPASLVALIAVSLLVKVMHAPMPLIGTIPEGLPDLLHHHLAGFTTLPLQDVLLSAIMLAALGCIDSLLTSIVADNLTKTKHKSNQELIGQGLGNMAGALIGGLPGAGATMRTVVNIKAGGRTRLSGIIHGLVLLLILLGAGKYAADIPKPVLAGILICVGLDIIDYKGFKHLFHVPRADAVVMLLVLFMTVFVNLLTAVAVGLILSSVLFMKKMGDIVEAQSISGSADLLRKEFPWPDESRIPNEVAKQVYIKHLQGPLFFGFTSQFQEMVNRIPDVKWVIIRMDKVPYIDQSGLYAIEEAVLYLEKREINVILAGVQSQPKDMLRRIKLIPSLISEEEVFDDIDACTQWLQQHLSQPQST